jgi:hypothetical protein
MARITPRIDVAAKAGRNKPVKHVMKLETLLRHLRTGAPAAAKKPHGLKVHAGRQSDETRKLLADLERQTRALRRAAAKSTSQAKK